MADNVEKKTRGRQRVPLIRMEKDSNRLVTFSKRRVGLFKKVSELCTLCGAEAAVIVFSPGRKAFSFGHPSVDATLNRFLFVEPHFNSKSQAQTVETQEDDGVLRSNIKLSVVHDHYELEKKRYGDFIIDRKLRKDDFEWINQAQELGGENLDKIQGLITPLKENVCHMYHAFLMEINNANDSLFTGPNASKPAYQFSNGMVGRPSPPSTLFDGPVASKPVYQFSQGMIEGQSPPSTLFDGPNASKPTYQFSQGMVGGQSPPSTLFDGSNASKLACQSSQGIVGGHHLPSTLFDGHPHPQSQSYQIAAMVSPNLVGGPNDHQIVAMASTNLVGGSSNYKQPQFQSHQTAAMVPPNLVGGDSNHQTVNMAPTNLVGGPSNYGQPQPQSQFQSHQITTIVSPNLVGGPNNHQIATMAPNNLVGGPSNYGQPQPQFQSHQVGAMVPPNLVGGPSNHQTVTMAPTNMVGGFGDPSLTRGSNDMAIDHLPNADDNVNANTTGNVNVNPLPSLPNPIGFDFPNPNLLPSFQGENNPIVGQFNGLPPLPSLDMDMSPMPVNFRTNPMPINFGNSSSSSQAEMNSMDTLTTPYNLQNGYGFGNDGFY